ncbi:MAG: L-threonylcarbamoyladenylate synthase, partial [Candidatus Cybelea sp.]
MAILPADPQNVARAGDALRCGGVVAFPTETVYGLGALAFNRAAVARVFEIKRRPRFDPLIVHVLDREMLSAVVAAMPRSAEQLVDRFWPGPLTLLLEKSAAVPELVTAGSSHVAVRMPSHP